MAAPEPARQIALAWRRSSVRKAEFRTLGRQFKAALGAPAATPRQRAG